MAENLARTGGALAGVRLIGRAPLAFLAWVVVRIVEQYVSLVVLLITASRWNIVGPVWAVLLAVPFEAVLVAALLRAQLRPKAAGFAFLRLGHTEFRMAGLLLIAGLVGALVALPASIGAAYLAFMLQQRLLAGSALMIGSVSAVLVLVRFSPAAAILVDEQKTDLGRAWRASRGHYILLAVIVIAAIAVDRLSGVLLTSLGTPPALESWASLASPVRLVGLAWRSVTGVAALSLMAGAVATVWRSSKQTLD